MRLHTAALYTLAALIARDLTQQANASPPPEPLADVPEASSAAESPDHLASSVEAIVPPESPETVTFSPAPHSPAVSSTEALAQDISSFQGMAYPERLPEWNRSQPQAIAPASDLPEDETEGAAAADREPAPLIPATAIASPERSLESLYTLSETERTQRVEEVEAEIMEMIANRPVPLTPQLAQASSVSQLSDVQGHWAEAFIRALTASDVIQGFEDGSFQPNTAVTRAEYAALIQQAFETPSVRPSSAFVDVPTGFWATSAIQAAYQAGFLDSVSAQQFSPNAPISRAEAIAALVNGLRITGTTARATALSDYFGDAGQIPDDLRGAIAAAVDHDIIVNYPDVEQLRPNQPATRADVAAFIHQALAYEGQIAALPAAAVPTPYIVTTGTRSSAPGSIGGTSGSTSAETVSLPDAPRVVPPDPGMLGELQTELGTLEDQFGVSNPDRSAPALTLSNPSGFGLDRGRFFISGTFQSETRYSNAADGAVGFGVGLGDARRAVGVELSYTIGSFGGNRNFGTGGFNARLHRRFSESFSASVGWNGFLILGEEDGDFEDSVYGSMTKIFRLREDLNDPFSRIAVTAGAGTGQFRNEDDVVDDNFAVSPFGSIALRIAEPVSLITEWTGQDLGVGLSIAPFRNANIVITPAVRDLAGAGDEPRFVLGFGASF